MSPGGQKCPWLRIMAFYQWLTLNQLNHTYFPILSSGRNYCLRKTQKGRNLWADFHLSYIAPQHCLLFSLVNLFYHFLQYSVSSPLFLKLPTPLLLADHLVSYFREKKQTLSDENFFNFLLQNMQTYRHILPLVIIEDVSSVVQDILPISALDCLYSYPLKIFTYRLALLSIQLYYLSGIFPIMVTFNTNKTKNKNKNKTEIKIIELLFPFLSRPNFPKEFYNLFSFLHLPSLKTTAIYLSTL